MVLSLREISPFDYPHHISAHCKRTQCKSTKWVLTGLKWRVRLTHLVGDRGYRGAQTGHGREQLARIYRWTGRLRHTRHL